MKSWTCVVYSVTMGTHRPVTRGISDEVVNGTSMHPVNYALIHATKYTRGVSERNGLSRSVLEPANKASKNHTPSEESKYGVARRPSAEDAQLLMNLLGSPIPSSSSCFPKRGSTDLRLTNGHGADDSDAVRSASNKSEIFGPFTRLSTVAEQAGYCADQTSPCSPSSPQKHRGASRKQKQYKYTFVNPNAGSAKRKKNTSKASSRIVKGATPPTAKVQVSTKQLSKNRSHAAETPVQRPPTSVAGPVQLSKEHQALVHAEAMQLKLQAATSTSHPGTTKLPSASTLAVGNAHGSQSVSVPAHINFSSPTPSLPVSMYPVATVARTTAPVSSSFLATPNNSGGKLTLAKRVNKMRGNRLAAKRCRERKKQYITYLEERVVKLEASNMELSATLNQLRIKNSARTESR
eukprot:m.94604 g.94604  ORF g.94604 m.94604 type:complete len:407 (+) comp16553_c0_seq2:260-1480(+)